MDPADMTTADARQAAEPPAPAPSPGWPTRILDPPRPAPGREPGLLASDEAAVVRLGAEHRLGGPLRPRHLGRGCPVVRVGRAGSPAGMAVGSRPGSLGAGLSGRRLVPLPVVGDGGAPRGHPGGGRRLLVLQRARRPRRGRRLPPPRRRGVRGPGLLRGGGGRRVRQERPTMPRAFPGTPANGPTRRAATPGCRRRRGERG